MLVLPTPQELVSYLNLCYFPVEKSALGKADLLDLSSSTCTRNYNVENPDHSVYVPTEDSLSCMFTCAPVFNSEVYHFSPSRKPFVWYVYFHMSCESGQPRCYHCDHA